MVARQTVMVARQTVMVARQTVMVARQTVVVADKLWWPPNTVVVAGRSLVGRPSIRGGRRTIRGGSPVNPWWSPDNPWWSPDNPWWPPDQGSRYEASAQRSARPHPAASSPSASAARSRSSRTSKSSQSATSSSDGPRGRGNARAASAASRRRLALSTRIFQDRHRRTSGSVASEYHSSVEETTTYRCPAKRRPPPSTRGRTSPSAHEGGHFVVRSSSTRCPWAAAATRPSLRAPGSRLSRAAVDLLRRGGSARVDSQSRPCSSGDSTQEPRHSTQGVISSTSTTTSSRH